MLMLAHQPVWPAFMKRVLDAGAGADMAARLSPPDDETTSKPNFFARELAAPVYWSIED